LARFLGEDPRLRISAGVCRIRSEALVVEVSGGRRKAARDKEL
jgi:hypothetical protein